MAKDIPHGNLDGNLDSNRGGKDNGTAQFVQ